jgi:hypothetical protein
MTSQNGAYALRAGLASLYARMRRRPANWELNWNYECTSSRGEDRRCCRIPAEEITRPVSRVNILFGKHRLPFPAASFRCTNVAQ